LLFGSKVSIRRLNTIWPSRTKGFRICGFRRSLVASVAGTLSGKIRQKGLCGLNLLRGLQRALFGQLVEPLELVIGPKVTPLRRRGDGFYILRHDLTPVRFTLFDEGIQSFLRIFRFDYVADRIDYIFDGTAIFVVVRTHETVAADPHDGG